LLVKSILMRFLMRFLNIHSSIKGPFVIKYFIYHNKSFEFIPLELLEIDIFKFGNYFSVLDLINEKKLLDNPSKKVRHKEPRSGLWL